MIYYWKQKQGIKNKSGNANLTIDWFKKHFTYPIDKKYFKFTGYCSYRSIPPQIETLIYCIKSNLKVEGTVFKIVEVEIETDKKSTKDIHILLK